jgi:transmembrane sensor
MTREEYFLLYEKMLSNNLSEEDKKLLDHFTDDFTLDKTEWNEKLMGNKDAVEKQIFNRIIEVIETKHSRFFTLKIWVAAASLTALLSIGGLYYFNSTPSNSTILTEVFNFKSKIIPNVTQPTLILSNGAKISLNGANNNIIENENGYQISNTSSSIIYKKLFLKTEKTTQAYNTLITPNHVNYQVQLEDGTKVWLNAASSIHYPVSFSGANRVVEITGEAYFEVAENKNKPFKVLITGGKRNKRLEVEVLGTHFNIQAYNKEDYKISLIEGSVKVKEPQQNGLILEKGEQALMKTNSNQFEISKIDTANVLAWKNGLFIFNNENIQKIMLKISRWYDVEVIYDGDMSNKRFVGSISRGKNLSEVLKTLELTGTIKFEIKGKKVIVK